MQFLEGLVRVASLYAPPSSGSTTPRGQQLHPVTAAFGRLLLFLGDAPFAREFSPPLKFTSK